MGDDEEVVNLFVRIVTSPWPYFSPESRREEYESVINNTSYKLDVSSVRSGWQRRLADDTPITGFRNQLSHVGLGAV
jgi:hypothetical protein